MKEKLIHVCFVIDESGSMFPSIADVTGGYERIIKDQKETKEGSCIVSMYKFNTKVDKAFIGKDVNEVDATLNYSPGGGTALYDAVGTAIDEIGKWLSDMKEEERPEKNLIVIMTDGEENSSKEYSSSDVKDKIKHQEEKYNWEFMYLGVDLSNFKDANALGIRMSTATTRKDMNKYYHMVGCSLSKYRISEGTAEDRSKAFKDYLTVENDTLLKEYKQKTGINIDNA